MDPMVQISMLLRFADVSSYVEVGSIVDMSFGAACPSSAGQAKPAEDTLAWRPSLAFKVFDVASKLFC
jgi:hypothetical protein